MKHRRVLAMFVFIIASCSIGLSQLFGVVPQDSTVVSVVNGDAITYGDIKVANDAQIPRVRFKRVHGRDPQSKSDWQVIERYRHEREMENLLAHIRIVVRHQQMKRFGIDPTERDIQDRWQRWCQEREAEGETVDLKAVTEQTKTTLRRLTRALKEVIDDGQDPNGVYERRLAGTMSREQWESHLRYDSSPKRRKMLEHALEMPDSKLVDYSKGFRLLVIGEELNEAIESELMSTDPEFAEYVRLSKTDPGNKKVQGKGPLYKKAKIYEWWQQMYRKAKIEIKDDRFQDVLTKLPL